MHAMLPARNTFPFALDRQGVLQSKKNTRILQKIPHLLNPSVYHITPKKVKSSTLGMRGGNAN